MPIIIKNSKPKTKTNLPQKIQLIGSVTKTRLKIEKQKHRIGFNLFFCYVFFGFVILRVREIIIVLLENYCAL